MSLYKEYGLLVILIKSQYIVHTIYIHTTALKEGMTEHSEKLSVTA